MNTFILIFIVVVAFLWLWALGMAAREADLRAANFAVKIENPFVQGGEVGLSRMTHNHENGGSNPSPATTLSRELFRVYLKALRQQRPAESAKTNPTAADIPGGAAVSLS